jgi:large subunit ribosomal protein L52
MDRIVLARVVRSFGTNRGVLVRDILAVGNVQLFHTTASVEAGRSWRVSTGRSGRGNTYGPLTDLPDWSYADGRPAPLGTGQLKRLIKQKDYADYIYKTVHAIGLAREEIAKASSEASASVTRKLKPKGGAC